MSWHRIRFGDFVNFNPRVHLEKGSEYSFLVMDNLQPGVKYISTESRRIFSGAGSRFENRDTLFARITPCLENGKIAQVKGLAGCGFGSTEFFVLRGKEHISDSDFIYYLCLTDTIREPAIQSMIGTSGRQRAQASAIQDINILVPSLAEQRKIASILSAYDDLITLNQRRIQLLEESARLLYREWFVKLRFPGHESVAVTDGVPEGWQVTRLARVADVNPASLSSKDKPESILYVDISTVNPGEIGEYREYIFEDAPGRARRKVMHGDIIWSCVRPNRRSYALIWEPDERLIVSTGFAVLTAIALPFSYLYLAITTDEFVGYLEKHATGAAYPAVTGKDFENAPILLPDKETLNQFDGLVLPILEQAEILKRQNQGATPSPRPPPAQTHVRGDGCKPDSAA